MQILKRNQIIILVMSLMLITAGYLNFTTKTAQTNGKSPEVGDAQLVNSDVITNNDTLSSENVGVGSTYDPINIGADEGRA